MKVWFRSGWDTPTLMLGPSFKFYTDRLIKKTDQEKLKTDQEKLRTISKQK